MNASFVFFVDVDNTLLDNDRIKKAIRQSLARVLGEVEANHFWKHHDEFRAYKKLVDFPNITRTYCAEVHNTTCELTVGSIFTGIDFASALFPKALEVLSHLKTLGQVQIFSEGDLVYQKMKIENSGIANSANGVLLYEHKLDHLPDILEQFTDLSYVFIDDRDDKLMEIKKKEPMAMTVVVCQGHYVKPDCPMNHTADKVVASIAELMSWSQQDFNSSLPRNNQGTFNKK